MVFQLQDSNKTFSGKDWDRDANKGFFQNIKDKIFIAPDDKQIALVDKYTQAVANGDDALSQFLSAFDDKDPLKTYFTTLDGGIATQKGMAGALNKTTLASKAAATGMQLLAVAKNMALMAGISFVLSLPSRIAQAQEELRQGAVESAQAFKETADSLEGYKNKVSELRTALSSGNLSQAEAYDARANLMQIQGEIIDKYGEEAGAIDLVSGSLRNQIKALDEIAIKEANRNLAANKTINERAVHEMEKVGVYQIGLGISSVAKDELGDLVSQFESKGIKINPFGDGATLDIILNANAEDATKTLAEFSSKLKDLKIDQNIKDEIGGWIELNIKDAQKTLDNYAVVYDTYNLERIISDNDYSKIYKESEDALKAYIESVKKGDKDQIASSLNVVAAIKNKALSTDDVGYQHFFEGLFSSIDSELEKRQFEIDIKADTSGIKAALSDLHGLDAQGILNLGDVQGTASQEMAFSLLSKKAEEYGTSIDGLIEWLVELGLVYSRVSEDNQSTELFSSEQLSKAITDTQASISALSSAYKEQFENQNISAETLSKLMLEHENWADLISIENGIITLNGEVAVETAKQKISAKIDEVEANLNAAKDVQAAAISEMESLRLIAESYKVAAQAALTFEQTAGGKASNIGAGLRQKAIDNNIKELEQSIKGMDAGIAESELTVEALRASFNRLDSSNPFGNLSGAASNFNDSLKAQGDIYIKVIEKRISKLQEQKDAEAKYYDEKIEQLNEEKQALNDKAEAENKELELAKKKAAWEALQNQRTTLVYKEGEGFVYDVDQEAVDNAKEDYDNAKAEYDRYLAIKAIDEEIEMLEEAKRISAEAIDSQIKDWQKLKDNISEQMSHIGETFNEHAIEMQLMADAEVMNYSRMAQAARDYAEACREALAAEKSGTGKGMYSESGNFANGGVAPRDGIYRVDDNVSGGKELITKKRGRLTFLQQGDKVFNSYVSEKIMGWNKDNQMFLANRMVDVNVKRGMDAVSSMGNSTHQNMPINISGGIIINNPIGDVNSLARSIQQNLDNVLTQELYKRK